MGAPGLQATPREVRLGPAFLCSPGLGRQGWTHRRSEGRAGASAGPGAQPALPAEPLPGAVAWSPARVWSRDRAGAGTVELISEPCPPCSLALLAVTEHWLA